MISLRNKVSLSFCDQSSTFFNASMKLAGQKACPAWCFSNGHTLWDDVTSNYHHNHNHSNTWFLNITTTTTTTTHDFKISLQPQPQPHIAVLVWPQLQPQPNIFQKDYHNHNHNHTWDHKSTAYAVFRHMCHICPNNTDGVGVKRVRETNARHCTNVRLTNCTT